MASKKKKQQPLWPRVYARKITKLHFGYLLAHALLIVIFDSWNLLTPESVKNRWTLVAVIVGFNAILWFLTRLRFDSAVKYRFIIAGLIISDLILAWVYVYWERGMASLSVALFIVPIVIAAGERSRGIIMSTSVIAAAAYSTSIIRYFNESPSEGFRVQLYGTTFFYSALFIFIGALLITVLHTPKREVS